jgi:DnaJ family protein A protein 5
MEPETVYIEQEWQKTTASDVEDLEWPTLAEGNHDPEVFECVVCGKSFKSEAAWNSHERSKKHIKNLEVLRRQMKEESLEFGLPAAPGGELGPWPTEESGHSWDTTTPPPVDDGSDTEHEITHKTRESQGFQGQAILQSEATDETKGIPPQDSQKLSKRDKRKLREARKQAQVVENAHVSDWRGNIDVTLKIRRRDATFVKQSSRADRGCSITSGTQATRSSSQPPTQV